MTRARGDRRPWTDRAVMACFPKSWRADGRAAEAIGIAWDAADDERREVIGTAAQLDLSWLGLRARIRAASVSFPAVTLRVVAAAALAGGLVLAGCLSAIAAWPPAGSVKHPLATAGPVLYVLWALSGVAVGAGREVVARWLLALNVVLTATVGLLAGSVGVRRPALFVLATLLLLNVLALPVRNVIRGRRSQRWTLVGVALTIGVGAGSYCRGAITLFPTDAYFGSATMLTGVANVVLVLLAVASLLASGSSGGRQRVIPALLLTAGPWALLASRGVAGQPEAIHVRMLLMLAGWMLIDTALYLIVRASRTDRTVPIH